jgi:hypothetical protein
VLVSLQQDVLGRNSALVEILAQVVEVELVGVGLAQELRFGPEVFDLVELLFDQPVVALDVALAAAGSGEDPGKGQ